MLKTLDISMLNVPHDLRVLAPLCRQYGIEALSATRAVFEDKKLADEVSAALQENGLSWGQMPMPADFYNWELTDEGFEKALETLKRDAETAEKLGIRYAYNHVWSSGPREYDENFEWHVRRVRAVSRVLKDHGVRYGLEFLGPHELLSLQPHPFIHTLAGALALADAADGIPGIALDTFHWYCSSNGDRDALLYLEQNIGRLVMLHLNDAVEGLPYNEQHDLERRLPMTTGIIDSRSILARFIEKGGDALYMIEPFEPGRTHFGALSAEDAVREAAEVFARLGV